MKPRLAWHPQLAGALSAAAAAPCSRPWATLHHRLKTRGKGAPAGNAPTHAARVARIGIGLLHTLAATSCSHLQEEARTRSRGRPCMRPGRWQRWRRPALSQTLKTAPVFFAIWARGGMMQGPRSIMRLVDQHTRQGCNRKHRSAAGKEARVHACSILCKVAAWQTSFSAAAVEAVAAWWGVCKPHIAQQDKSSSSCKRTHRHVLGQHQVILRGDAQNAVDDLGERRERRERAGVIACAAAHAHHHPALISLLRAGRPKGRAPPPRIWAAAAVL